MVNFQSESPLEMDGVLQAALLDLLFFLIYINEFSLGLTTDFELLADITSLFSVVDNISVSAS